ncbi:(2Fe-2S) ferredoxin domain-containing protein [Bradyrhizobium diazoefficiens]|nr:(2Fe-2S) ferredoxin domain-containing protein [Bradyrhizobium diazoefficiens]MBR0701098.1 (2Fe-2S) ferredoxin domain-containing protein [Bradyrhizobium diazoefficiens]MBR0769523.1 (2Fe-2S) ferredoxin domain-containing protein [Bradyrhizobium diazoefficiens]
MSENKQKSASPMVVRPRRAAPVLVCRKCLKRSDDGRDVRRALKSELKTRKHDGSKPAKLIMTGCFGLCPKKAVVLASGTSLARQEYVLVADGDQVPRALKLLNGERGG